MRSAFKAAALALLVLLTAPNARAQTNVGRTSQHDHSDANHGGSTLRPVLVAASTITVSNFSAPGYWVLVATADWQANGSASPAYSFTGLSSSTTYRLDYVGFSTGSAVSGLYLSYIQDSGQGTSLSYAENKDGTADNKAGAATGPWLSCGSHGVPQGSAVQGNAYFQTAPSSSTLVISQTEAVEQDNEAAGNIAVVKSVAQNPLKSTDLSVNVQLSCITSLCVLGASNGMRVTLNLYRRITSDGYTIPTTVVGGTMPVHGHTSAIGDGGTLNNLATTGQLSTTGSLTASSGTFNGSVAAQGAGSTGYLVKTTNSGVSTYYEAFAGGTSGADWVYGTGNTAFGTNSSEDVCIAYKNSAGTGLIGCKAMVSAGGGFVIGAGSPLGTEKLRVAGGGIQLDADAFLWWQNNTTGIRADTTLMDFNVGNNNVFSLTTSALNMKGGPFNPSQKTIAQLAAITPAVGDVYSCSNCANTYDLVVGTNAVIEGFREVGTNHGPQ